MIALISQNIPHPIWIRTFHTRTDRPIEMTRRFEISRLVIPQRLVFTLGFLPLLRYLVLFFASDFLIISSPQQVNDGGTPIIGTIFRRKRQCRLRSFHLNLCGRPNRYLLRLKFLDCIGCCCWLLCFICFFFVHHIRTLHLFLHIPITIFRILSLLLWITLLLLFCNFVICSSSSVITIIVTNNILLHLLSQLQLLLFPNLLKSRLIFCNNISTDPNCKSSW
mmetsp:Transcript_4282/g.7176  ORF Transcript_4282/g.7176 Transcript_4282/m.7176 type:complete len:222 (+) Transcript_4282:2791-3456(+)